MLSIEDVTVRFELRGKPPVTALDRVSLAVEDRQFSVIVGPSGCVQVKSTLLRLVAGLQVETEGRVTLDGAVIRGPSVDRGMVFQSYTLFPWLTVRGNVEFGPGLKGVPRAERTRISADLMGQVGLAGFEDAYPEQLSGGMRQRVALARALANDPKVLLMERAIRRARQPDPSADAGTPAGGLGARPQDRALHHPRYRRGDLPSGRRPRDDGAPQGRIKRSLPIDIPRPRGAGTPDLHRLHPLPARHHGVDARGGPASRPGLTRGKSSSPVFAASLAEVDSANAATCEANADARLLHRPDHLNDKVGGQAGRSGTRRISELREKVHLLRVVCVFDGLQFDKRLVDTPQWKAAR